MRAASDPASPGPVARMHMLVGGRRALPACLILVVVATVTTVPVGGTQLHSRASFVPAMIALVGILDVLSTVLLISQFRDTGNRIFLALAWAYAFSLVVLAGYGGAFPGVLENQRGPLGHDASTAPWLWSSWHTGFPVLLAVAVSPWMRRRTEPVPAAERQRWVRVSLPLCVAAGAGLVAFVVLFDRHLPTLIHGTDTTLMTRTVGPVMLPIVAGSTLVAVWGAFRLSGPARWVALAAVAAQGDVALTLFSGYRYSLGWYVGRSLTVVSSAVVLIAMLAEFTRLKSMLASEADRLRVVLERTDELERLQHTLLEHLAEGVMMQGPDGRVLASNPAVTALLGAGADDLASIVRSHLPVRLLDADGLDLAPDQAPDALTRSTGEPQRDRIVGVALPGGGRRWLRINTTATGQDPGNRFVVSSMTDDTERHEQALVSRQQAAQRRDRIEQVLADAELQVVVQPIVDLHTGAVVGAEALSRFSGHPHPTPDRWFAEADEVLLGTELELLAVRMAFAHQRQLPESAYLSVNVSPAVAMSAELAAELRTVNADRIVLELTEHADVEDYPTLMSALSRLRAAGVRVAVDDTGAGFASLRHILNLRPDIIKLDLALVRGIHTDPARRALARGMLTFASEIGADIVAEGVETVAELTELRAIGIPFGQGYHLGRPAAPPLADRVGLGTPQTHVSLAHQLP